MDDTEVDKETDESSTQLEALETLIWNAVRNGKGLYPHTVAPLENCGICNRFIQHEKDWY